MGKLSAFGGIMDRFLRMMLDFQGDYTPLQHVALAVSIQVCVWLLFVYAGHGLSGIIAGGLCAFGVMASREVAQAEKRKTDWPAGYADSYLRGLFFWMWDEGSQRDLFWPVVGIVIVSLAGLCWG